MRPLARLLALLAAFAVVPGILLAASAHDEAPLTVTTDTRAYCAALARRVSARDGLSEEARRLAADGRAMCDEGRVRGGIVRLRRALMLAQGAGSP